MIGKGGNANDRGLDNIATDALCAAECDKRESCTFYAFSPNNDWCYLWKGATCSPVAYGSYKIKQKSCGNLIF